MLFCTRLKSFKALKYKIIVLLLLLTHLGFGQSIGVRAGWNFNTISGPLEIMNLMAIPMAFTLVSIMATNCPILYDQGELLYNQTGGRQKFDGSSYYLIYTRKKRFTKRQKDTGPEITTSYISLPITAVFQPWKKLNCSPVFHPTFWSIPTGRGTVRFYSSEHPQRSSLNSHLTTIFTKTWRWQLQLPIRALQNHSRWRDCQCTQDCRCVLSE